MRKELLLSFALLLLSALGCSRFAEFSRSSHEPINANANIAANTNPDGVPTGEFAPSGEAAADIKKMAERFLKLESFRAKMDGEGEMPMNAVLEFVAPDRYRFRTEQGVETIVIGKTTYLKVGGSWRKMPVALDSTITDMRATFDEEGMKWIGDVRYTGIEDLDGRPAYTYTYHNKIPEVAGGENDSKLWVAMDSGLPVKVEAVYRTGNLKKMTIIYEHSVPVSIEPPLN